jgi:ATPase family associated with various cellular activities (AAA)
LRESEDTHIIPSPTNIVPAPSGITPVSSSLAKTVIPSESELKNVTFWKLDLDTILDGLIPDPLPESSGKDNAIHHLNIIIFGKPNTGKTTLAESIAEALARRYGKNNVKALRSTRDLPLLFQSIDKLFGRFKKPPKAILLFADDMTKAIKKLSGTVDVTGSSGKAEKMRRVDYWLDKWYDIRGELFRHGMHQGLVVMVAGLHRFYGGDIDLRADADLLLVRSTGTPGTFDANKVERMLGPVVYYGMRQHEVDALRDRRELSWTAFVAKTGSGVFRVSRPSLSESWLMRDVGPVIATDEIDDDLDESVERPTNRTINVSAKKSLTKERPVTLERDAIKERPATKARVAARVRHKEHKWVRRFSRALIATGVLTILYLAYTYVWPFIR